MAVSTPHRRAPGLGVVVSDSVYGAALATAGLGIAYLALATPMVSVLFADRLIGTGNASLGLGIRALSIIAAGALMLAGTDRLAATLASIRTAAGSVGPGARALGSVDDVSVLAGVVPIDGRAIPELVTGPFGVAVLHALPAGRQYRQVGTGWEYRARGGWLPMDNPLDQASRDADSVRRWFNIADLEFVVRVYTALISPDGSFPRSASCAVVTPDQLPAWIGALPSQRSLTAARRLRLRSLAMSTVARPTGVGAQGW